MGTNLETLQAETGEALSKDEIFSTLSNQRRRYVIHYLKHDPSQVRIRDLAEQIAAWENDITVEELTYKQRKRVYTSLHQTHLPKMDDCGIVEYDRDRGLISLAPGAADLEVYLEVVSGNDLPWSDFYLGLSAAALLLVAVGWAGILPVDVPPLGYAAFIALAFGAAAGVHSYVTRQMKVGTLDVPPDDSAPANDDERPTGLSDPEPSRDGVALTPGVDESND
ncbi:hypothetical protein SAMN04487948_104377 [Halogranum amylolyticum]|uniref:DUF7344 domain-containing protein n=1 Tax=Halogranum amylolyticum TaxID=660520 RepID=A0A1H8S2P1_9EURY|nr:hypothetical protein [Halogranum amylolyticum]SEO72443.1 hypothetical protein SAMN04487948_104377 [Halogranum amylolyticum]